MSKAEERVDKIISGLPDKKVGLIWRRCCNSASAFLKTWPLGGDGRKLAFGAAQNGKTAARNGLVVARHASIALAKMAKQIQRLAKRAGQQLARDFICFVVLIGLWAARIVAGVLPDVPLTRPRKLNLEHQFQFPV